MLSRKFDNIQFGKMRKPNFKRNFALCAVPTSRKQTFFVCTRIKWLASYAKGD